MADNKGGRPTKYKPEYDEQVYKLCLLGATDEQLADFFGVAVQTIHNWVAEHDGFLEARKNGKERADANVAEALYNRALGYSHPEEKIMSYEGQVIRANTTKHYPPDTAAAFIWLKNRAGWKDKQEVDHNLPHGPLVQVYMPDNGRDD
jgi:hypothetical protein